MLYLGDGNRRSAKNVHKSIDTVAGGNPNISYADGIPATEAYLASPWGVACHSDGSFFIAQGHSIRKVNTEGIITTVAGQQTISGSSGDEGLAIDARLAHQRMLLSVQMGASILPIPTTIAFVK